MRKILAPLLGLILLAAACNCGSSFTNSNSSSRAMSSQAAFKDDGMPRKHRRLRNKSLTEYITARTVSVRYDCSPKDGVVIVGSGRSAEQRHDGRGTGIIVRSYNDKSYVFTAAHVVSIDDASERKWFTCKTTIQFNKDAHGHENKKAAIILVKDDHRDLAVLEVDGDLGINTKLELDPFTGEDIWAAGYPVQKASPRSVILSITKGTLATKNVPVYGNSKGNGYFHRVTSQVYFGNSGGGVWTKEGKLLGIVVALYAGESKVPYEGYYYVKPVNEVVDLLKRRWKYDSVLGRR